MKKIIVIGCPGSGKTTFAERLRDKTRLPLFYLDAIWHKADRTHISREEFDARLADILSLDAWIIDGNYSRTIESRIVACDTVFLFDLPTEDCLAGAISRIGKKRYDMPWIDIALAPNLKIEIEEFLSFLDKRVGILDGVCVTGGEPLLNKDIAELLREIKARGFAVKLDTNGTRPDVLKSLVTDGLVDYVAMDIKNSPRRYAETCGLPASYDLSKIEESKSFLMTGAVDFEFRTTVAKPFHTEGEIREIGEWIAGEEKYFLQQFKDSGDILGEGVSPCDADEMKAFLELLLPFVPNAQLRGV